MPTDRDRLATFQGQRFRALLEEILPRNRFYARKLEAVGKIRDCGDLPRLPFTTKAELLQDQRGHPPYGSNLTYPVEQYNRLHQTSGTTAVPLRWLDTPESWQWCLDCWEYIYRAVGVERGDRLFFGFSFGPFLGFWSAFDAANRLGFFCLAGGGMSTGARLHFLLENRATVVLCTPTYALHLAEAAQQEGIDLAPSAVRALIVAGEPGGSILATRERIEKSWGARVFDHNGLTEGGPIGVECRPNPAGIHLLENEFLAEVIDPTTLSPVPAGQVGELVVTNLGRAASPVIRYRTGDLVRVDPEPCVCGSPFMRLAGGILGRVDDMIHVRGNNLYPGALEALVRRFPEMAEYRVEVDQTGSLTEVRVELEPVRVEQGPGLVEQVSRAIRDELLFRAEVIAVAPGSLPRYEMKARRVVVRRMEPQMNADKRR